MLVVDLLRRWSRLILLVAFAVLLGGCAGTHTAVGLETAQGPREKATARY
jgi:hypothetical protein